MSKAHPPELKKFMDKKLSLKLNGGRHVQGILRGFDPFMNLVIDECVEMATSGQQNNIGMVDNIPNKAVSPKFLKKVNQKGQLTFSKLLSIKTSKEW
ncbi:SNRPG isoform 7 [Pan troglodytes]|uniref:Small nuclear ribonucleoprotein G n=5 Tax=Homininae TaxID=207598 RepID=C9JVQ0_HUMAN|nr:small nuclear ribonucleoprotein G isoform b [Homo sapiens]XP_016860263.1 small nuclear ribonucleoprotein G isoform X1 [Homo sapiens]XP_054199495.1 small nuclear ribonucleoprotein G isoform X1 [Homo sapiens]XP_055234042.1 small nuclear ribonucleoprotein G isoform X6 [Gorilla gorilla gorilla]PNI66592.1 SNRPG isoform 7 [Pan troglodytes]KAI2523764.1 small nuclear ribonucleoprotein polypeptide G [Homo sapiens]KAI4034912.1 small nuclear ribonucleoprotein polypeptide G [Homo sapiens]|eukprot:NP_001304094.1 small nuclear ribonucleoprotein G isoform b [Homo sapiens]